MNRIAIAVLIIVAMLITGVGFAVAGEPYHVLSGRDKVGTYGQDGKSARAGFLNSIILEGDSSDTYETTLYPTDPTADNLIAVPDASGTMALTDSTLTGTFTGTVNGTILDSTNANIFVSNGTSMQSVTTSGLFTITNTGATTGTLADAKVWIGNSGGAAVAVTPSGDWTITNAGVATLAVNSVSVPQFGPINTVTATVTAGQTGTEIAVEAGSLLLGWQPVSGFNNAVTITKSVYDGTTWIINTDTGSSNGVINGTFLRP